jgi:hypothetical protein
MIVYLASPFAATTNTAARYLPRVACSAQSCEFARSPCCSWDHRALLREDAQARTQRLRGIRRQHPHSRSIKLPRTTIGAVYNVY